MNPQRLLGFALLPALATTAGAQSIQIEPAATAGDLGNAQQVAPFVGGLPPSGEAPMLRGDTAATGHGWSVQPVVTVSESYWNYLPVGIPDGVGALDLPGDHARIFLNHELGANLAYSYQLANGTSLKGARVSRFDLERRANGTLRIQDARPAYGAVFDRAGLAVSAPAQINETGSGINGFTRFCSSGTVAAGSCGFVDDIYFTGEEAYQPAHPHGGSLWALDVASETLWAVPAAGRAAFENVAALDSGAPSTSVALLIGDDLQSAPLYLYAGQKDTGGAAGFLGRNGLLNGRLYAWRADNGDLTPEEFNGLGSTRTGGFVELVVQDANMAGQPGYDALGYLNADTLRAQADALGCFSFSRPEDVSTNPLDGTQAAFCSTGSGSLYPSDNWGTVYAVDLDFSDLSCTVVILHDADGLPDPDAGIRSPDNVDWADNGKLYVQEDRATSPASLFGASTGIEASVWELDPVTHAFTRVAEIDRGAVAPAGSTDSAAGDLGNWESSGILDVTALFGTRAGERLYLATVMAHGIQDGPIASLNLTQGGQLVFLSKTGQ